MSARATRSAARARLREGSGGGGSGQGRGAVGKVAFKTPKRRQEVLICLLILSEARVVPVLGLSVMVSPVPCVCPVSQAVCAGTELPVLSLVIPSLLRCEM